MLILSRIKALFSQSENIVLFKINIAKNKGLIKRITQICPIKYYLKMKLHHKTNKKSI